MSERQNDPTHNRPEGPHTVESPALTADLGQFAEQIRTENAWQKSDRNAITVFKGEKITVVLGALRANATLTSPSATENTTTLQLLEGAFSYRVGEKTGTAKKGQLLVFETRQHFSISATEECLYLLTMAG